MGKRWSGMGRVVVAPLLCSVISLKAQSTQSAANSKGLLPPVVLVELFTSEGCSSCPPADALLRAVAGSQTKAGQLIVGISEHVTYWNQLGWADPYSAETYTARQNAYRQRFGLEGVYTPQMVINGSEQLVGSDRLSLVHTFEKESQRSQMSLRIVSSRVEGDRLSVTFSASGMTPGQPTEIMAVVADDVDRSSVSRGENSGQTLSHVAVARSLARVATLNEPTEKTVQVPLPESFKKAHIGHHLILFAQMPGLRAVTGADTKPI